MVDLAHYERGFDTGIGSGLSAQKLRLTRDESNPPLNVHFITLFDVLYIMGLVSLTAIVLTAWFSSRIQRTSTWFMFIISWLFTSVANLIILGQQTGPSPMNSICLLQAMLVYGLPVLNSLYAVAFMLQVYFTIQYTVEARLSIPRSKMILIHALPCSVFLAVLVEVLAFGLAQPDTISRDPSGMYCHLSVTVPNRVTAAITIGAMIMFLVLGFRVVLTLRRRYQALAQLALQQNKAYLSPDVATRVLIFSFCPIIALAVSLLQYLPQQGGVATKMNLVLAVLPLVASLIFGTQRDILRAWVFCSFVRKPDPADVEVKPATV